MVMITPTIIITTTKSANRPKKGKEKKTQNNQTSEPHKALGP